MSIPKDLEVKRDEHSVYGMPVCSAIKGIKGPSAVTKLPQNKKDKQQRIQWPILSCLLILSIILRIFINQTRHNGVINTIINSPQPFEDQSQPQLKNIDTSQAIAFAIYPQLAVLLFQLLNFCRHMQNQSILKSSFHQLNFQCQQKQLSRKSSENDDVHQYFDEDLQDFHLDDERDTGKEKVQEDKFKLSDTELTTSLKVMKKTPRSKITQEQRLSIQKTLAQKFITIGFGYLINMKAVKKRHKIAIQDTFYHCMMGGIVRRTFRIIQNFLIVNCHQSHLKPLAHHEVTFIRSPMLQCSKWLAKNELQTFYKFIMRSYDLKEVFITQDQAYKLYGQFVQSTRKVHEISHIVKRKNRTKSDAKNSQGLIFSYAPSSIVSSNRASYRPQAPNNLVQI